MERNHQTQYTNHKSQITKRKAQIANHKTSRNHQKTPLSNKHTASGVLGRGKKVIQRGGGRTDEELKLSVLIGMCVFGVSSSASFETFFTFRIPTFRSNNHHICIYSPSSLWLLTKRGDTNFARWFEFGHLAFFDEVLADKLAVLHSIVPARLSGN